MDVLSPPGSGSLRSDGGDDQTVTTVTSSGALRGTVTRGIGRLQRADIHDVQHGQIRWVRNVRDEPRRIPGIDRRIDG